MRLLFFFFFFFAHFYFAVFVNFSEKVSKSVDSVIEDQLFLTRLNGDETGWLSPFAGFDLDKSMHERITPVKTDSRGKRSVRLIGKAVVAINSDTGQLIQLNPRSEQK